MEKKRIRDFGIVPGREKTGKRNAITDVPGVLVGHCTVNTEENHTGVTVIVPGADNAFANHYTAEAYVHNGFGKFHQYYYKYDDVLSNTEHAQIYLDQILIHLSCAKAAASMVNKQMLNSLCIPSI